MQIRFLFTDETFVTLEIDPDDTVALITRALQEASGEKSSRKELQMVFMGIPLLPEQKIQNLDIKDGDAINVLSRMIGQARPLDERSPTLGYTNTLDSRILNAIFFFTFIYLLF